MRTKRLMEGWVAAERRMERVPATVGFMTTAGSEENVATVAM